MYALFADICGFVGSLLLLYAPVRDQFLRFSAHEPLMRAKSDCSLAELWEFVADGYDEKRNGWHRADALTMAAGASLLAVSFGLSLLQNQTLLALIA